MSAASGAMRIAIVSDIHGNLPALEAVLADLAERRVEEIVVGGDLVGRGPEGRRVVERIRSLGLAAIRGNHEEYLLAFRRGEVAPSWLEQEQWAAARWMAAELDGEAERFVAALPFSLARDGEVRIVHGSATSTQEGIGPWLDEGQLRAHLGSVRERVLVCGHTHRPLTFEETDGAVVNVGSVGLPFNGDVRAQYAILERAATGRWTVEPIAVPYDVEETRRSYERTGFREAGGITAELLLLELEHAQPFLVPFLRWARTVGVEPRLDELDAFLGFYSPGEPLGGFYRRLRALA